MRNHSQPKLRLIAASAVLSGLLTLGTTLFALVHLHSVRLAIADTHLTVIAGLSLVYLASLLRRGKYNAWLISLAVYAYLIIRNFQHFVIDFHKDNRLLPAILNLLIPVVTLIALIVFRSLFDVRSEIRSFTLALRRAGIILLAAFLYGVIGFQLFDERDYRQEISIPTSIHYTLDQANFTTSRQLVAYTKRARFFVDSLAAASLTSVTYVAVSFFAPIRFRLGYHRQDYENAKEIIANHSLTSEDFFKLWPPDKTYFFSPDRKAAIAYRVVGGVALAVGDPVGPKDSIRPLIITFVEYCRLNDWAPTFIHTDGSNLKLYKELGFSSQKIGEEALVDIKRFNETVARNKYFRHINNKFSKQNFSCELLAPPHSPELIAELMAISNDWLQQPGRTERGFMMGYFSEEYMQMCSLMVVRDASGHIQSFLNQLPSYKKDEANYDFLRQAATAPGNANDYLMLNFISNLAEQGFQKINMGLSPLTGLEPLTGEGRSAIDNLLHFVYANADRFYSFQGLAKFKSKYEPQWQPRYIIYRGGLPGFTRTLNTLLRAIKI